MTGRPWELRPLDREAVAEVLREMLTEIFPEKYVAVITGGREENSALLDMDFDMIEIFQHLSNSFQLFQCAAAYLHTQILL